MTTTPEVEIMDAPSDELVILSMTPGSDIEANFEALEARIGEILSDYRDLVVTSDYLSQAKKDRAFLNNLSKSMNQRRIEVKNRYMAPYLSFEERVKRLDAPIREASAAIDTQVKAFEETEKVEKREALVNHYMEYAGILVDAVPFERIEDPKWLNRSVPVGNAMKEIEEIVERIANDDLTLDGLQLSHSIEAKAEYFATLDLSKAIARSKALDDQEERARRLEEEKAALAAQRQETAPEPIPESVAPTPAEPAPAPVQAAVEQPAQVDPDALHEFRFTITCTRAQRDQVISALKSLGIKGTVSS